MYGLSFHPTRPFELFVSSRDLSIRRIFLRELGQYCVARLILKPVADYIEEFAESKALSADQLKRALRKPNENLVKRF